LLVSTKKNDNKKVGKQKEKGTYLKKKNEKKQEKREKQEKTNSKARK